MNKESSGKRPNPDGTYKLMRKKRAISGSNVHHAEYMASAECKMLSSLGEKNAAASRKWKSLSSDEKDRYNEAAAVMNSEDKAVDIKKEVKKLRDLLSLLVEHGNKIDGFDFVFVAVHEGNHITGGTKAGCDFLLKSGSHIPHSFLGYIASLQHCTDNSLPSTNAKQANSAEPLRTAVQDIFNECYGAYTDDLKAVMPYKYISKYGITMEGLPEGVVLKPPGSYGKATLKEIIARKDLLRVTCSTGNIELGTSEEEPSIQCASTAVDPHHEVSSATTPSHDHTYYNALDTTRTVSSVPHSGCRNDEPLSVGSSVKLLKNSNIVGMGRILDGDSCVHGKAIPQDYIKLEITQILPETTLLFSTPFDDDYLIDGQITAWPKNQCIPIK